MSGFESELRELIRGIVREELDRALADAKPTDDYLSTKAAATLASVAEGTIRRWIREGRITGHRAGRVLRLRRSDLEGLLHEDRPEREISPEEMARRDFG